MKDWPHSKKLAFGLVLAGLGCVFCGIAEMHGGGGFPRLQAIAAAILFVLGARFHLQGRKRP